MKKSSIFMFAVGLVIIAGVVYFLSKNQTNNQGSTDQTQLISEQPEEITLNYNSTDANFAPQTYKVKEGDQVTLKVTSDIADELHFHGYDLHTDLEAGMEGDISFTADKTGNFEFELEDHGIILGAVEVDPK